MCLSGVVVDAPVSKTGGRAYDLVARSRHRPELAWRWGRVRLHRLVKFGEVGTECGHNVGKTGWLPLLGDECRTLLRRMDSRLTIGMGCTKDGAHSLARPTPTTEKGQEYVSLVDRLRRGLAPFDLEPIHKNGDGACTRARHRRRHLGLVGSPAAQKGDANAARRVSIIRATWCAGMSCPCLMSTPSDAQGVYLTVWPFAYVKPGVPTPQD